MGKNGERILWGKHFTIGNFPHFSPFFPIGSPPFQTLTPNFNPQAYSLVSRRFHTPIVAILHIAFLAVVSLLIGNLDDLISSAVFTNFPFVVALAVGVFVGRYQFPKLARPFRTPFLAPVVLCVVGLAAFVFPLVIPATRVASLVWIGVLLLGVPIYLLFVRRVLWSCGGLDTVMDWGTQKIANLLNCE